MMPKKDRVGYYTSVRLTVRNQEALDRQSEVSELPKTVIINRALDDYFRRRQPIVNVNRGDSDEAI